MSLHEFSQKIGISDITLELALILVLYLLILFPLIRNKNFRENFLRLLSLMARSLFLIEREPILNSRLSRLKDREEALEKKIESLEQQIGAKTFGDKLNIIDDKLDIYLEGNLKDKIEQKINKINFQDEYVQTKINDEVWRCVDAFLKRQSNEGILQASLESKLIEDKRQAAVNLDEILERQMRTADKLKTVMINLFIIVNIGIMSFYMFEANAFNNLNINFLYSVLGLYISLAAFIIYIYRASNYRTSLVLAIREDCKKYFDALFYIERFKSNQELGEFDIEFLRSIMTNRSEREKIADHPYELVLKGISNSNTLLKGGKVDIEKK